MAMIDLVRYEFHNCLLSTKQSRRQQAETKIKDIQILLRYSLSPVKLTARKMIITSSDQPTDRQTDQLYLFSLVFAPSLTI